MRADSLLPSNVSASNVIKQRVISARYNYKPPGCGNNYEYGENNWHRCGNCHLSIKPATNGVETIIGCQVKAPINPVLAAKLNITSDAALMATNCNEFSPLEKSVSIFYLSDSVVPRKKKQIEQQEKEIKTRTARFMAGISSKCTISKELFALLNEATELTGKTIYRSIAIQANTGHILTDSQQTTIKMVEKNYDRLERYKEFRDRLLLLKDHKKRILGYFTWDNYFRIVNSYGYLTQTQEKRLDGAEAEIGN